MGVPAPVIDSCTTTSRSSLAPASCTVTSNESFEVIVMLVAPAWDSAWPPGLAVTPIRLMPWRPGATGPPAAPPIPPSRAMTTDGRTHWRSGRKRLLGT